MCSSAQCLQHLDVSVLGELVPRLCELLKSGVGLGTKVDTHTYTSASDSWQLCLAYVCTETGVPLFMLALRFLHREAVPVLSSHSRCSAPRTSPRTRVREAHPSLDCVLLRVGVRDLNGGDFLCFQVS